MGYSLDECLAFGDSQNDIPMIQACKIGIAMGNAIDEVKDASDFVTSNIKEDGIYNGLKHFEII